VDALGCGNGSDRTQHPSELLGDDWYLWGDWGIVASGKEEKEPRIAPEDDSAAEDRDEIGA
jgi:hypothetical protein